ncbi:methyltransferase domain-containing protein [Patescibacteria group bacterium]
MDKRKLYEKYLICPKCAEEIENNVCLGCGRKYKVIDGDILDFFEINKSNELSQKKWEEVFQDEFFQEKAGEEFKEVFLEDTLRQMLDTIPCNKGVYLEIGCGQGHLGEELASRGDWFFIGVDYSKTALLQLKKRLKKRNISNFLLVRADINELPVRSSTVDLVCGNGVIEHLEDTQRVVNHLHRVLKSGGISFNTVPVFNIGNLVYRSFWGGIPNIPILKQVAEFVHIKLLKGKHMVFGYELQFTYPQLFKMHVKAGFKKKNIKIERFECHIHVHKLKNFPRLRKFFIKLCKTNRNFWPMIKVIAQKL